MLTTQRRPEALLLDTVADHLEKLDVVVTSAEFDGGAGVIDLTLQLPPKSDQHLRREVLALLSTFEHSVDRAIVVSPTFVWENDADDE